MIVGTAGHIDHGKTLLVKALTGIDCDRLKEEKARGITIELGFAYTPLPGGGVLGFVDVPGHERFVHTMLAGAASIDFALLVVAADDGVMPQTREHLQILDLLGLREGIVALNKADLVSEERLAEVEREVRTALTETSLAAADILTLSAATGAGVEALQRRLVEEAESRPARAHRGAFRMAVDRSFTVAGAGTVVTGVVVSGRIATGDTVIGLPAGTEARVRAIHALGRPAETAEAGQRAALNVVGLDRQAVARGHWLVAPDLAATSARFDARFRLLLTEPRPLRTWAPVHLHVGATSLEARVVMLEGEVLAPGESGLVQIVASTPLPVRAGDRIVLRDAGGERTIGGGTVIDPAAPQRFRRTPARLATLAAMGEPEGELAVAALLELEPGIVDLSGFAAGRGLSKDETQGLIEAVAPHLVEIEGRQFAASPAALDGLGAKAKAALAAFHAARPEQVGMSSDALRLALAVRLTRPNWHAVLAMLAPRGEIVLQGGLVRLANHASSLGAGDQRLWERIEAAIDGVSRYRPPAVRELAEATGQPITGVRKLLKTMARMGTVVEVATDRFFLRPAVGELGRMAAELAAASPTQTFTAAGVRDRAGSGRSVGIQILEHFDRRGLTLRQGEARRIVKHPDALFGSRKPR